jgi:transcriptional regulator with XRE-family HTH domain
VYLARILRPRAFWTHNAFMRKSTHTPHFEALRARLAELRKEAGLTQRQLAEKLGREHSFVWRVEKGERRLDLVEFYWVCRELGVDAAETYSELCLVFKKCDRR